MSGDDSATHSCVNLKVYEVAPYYLDANFNVVPFNAITVNMDTWNDLPEDVQNIISEVGEGYLTMSLSISIRFTKKISKHWKSRAVPLQL